MEEGLRAWAPNFSFPAVKEKPSVRITKFSEFSGHLLGRRAQYWGQMHRSHPHGGWRKLCDSSHFVLQTLGVG